MKILKFTLALFASCALTSAMAATIYTQGQGPFAQKQKANPYKAGNKYNPESSDNPYSSYRSPYNPQSVFGNTDKYGQQIQNKQGQKQGISSQYRTNSQSITNPYGKYGNPYSSKNPSKPYNSQGANNPYSDYRAPYNPKSLNQSTKYAPQIYHKQGQPSGYLKTDIYNNKAANNPYSKQGNPYGGGNIADPYNYYPHTQNK